MSKITEYVIVTANSSIDLEDIVSGMIKDGWQPLGGVCVVTTAVTNTNKAPGKKVVTVLGDFYQAMVR